MASIASRRLAFAAGTAGLILCGMGRAAAADEPPAPQRHAVTIEGNAFTPETLTVSAGDTIVWANQDFYPHTVTEKSSRFDSSAIPAGESWTFEADTEGTFEYTCAFHPTMKGTLRVR